MPRLDFIAPLFVPASRPERFAKAAASGADAVILDLEDAVRPEDKAAARQAVTTAFTTLPVVLRINGAGTSWHGADLDVAMEIRPAAIMLPKAEFSPVLQGIGEKAARRGIGVIALIETARGIAHAERIAAAPGVVRLAFGSVDYAADIGCAHTRTALAHARSLLVLASRLSERIAPLDGVTTEIEDGTRIEDDARHSRELGFGGKLCIHPRQIQPVLGCWKPSASDIQWASRIVGTEGAVAVDGEMVDEPVRARARAILARVAASPARSAVG
ncbi:MAG: CoA ester lyase [Rhizobiales bacterium]|nr:CoA ester lyase [Hyphomicrobiales bacterium]